MSVKLPKLKKNNKYFYLFIIGGILLLILSVFLMPVWNDVSWAAWKNWGTQFINLIVAFFLSIYIFGFLLKKMIKTGSSTIKLLMIIEFILLVLVDLYLVLGQWIPQIVIIKTNGACATFGLALWIRGCVEIFRAYFHQRDSKSYYPLWWVAVALAFVSIGMWMMVAPFFQDVQLLWLFIVVFIIFGIFFIGYGIYSKPEKNLKNNK